jgi:predicted lipid-binding transport protein (Tim44 family)
MEAIEAIPPKDREVIQAHINGLNHSEISKKLSISISASMNRLYRARKKISAQIKDLLYAIVGLPKMLPRLCRDVPPFKKIASGGILAMKIGASTKITIGVIGVLAAGFIGFKVVTSRPDVKSPKVETQQALTAKGKQGGATVSAHKPLSSKSSHQPKGADSKITQNERDIARLDEKEQGEFPTQLVEEASSLDKEMTQEAEQRHDEEYTKPAESENTAEKLMQKILEAFRNADYETLFAISKGKIRKDLEETLEKYGEASAEEKALAKKAELSDSWYVGDDKFHFTIIFQGYTYEYILQRDDNKWWLVDDIPAVIKKTGADRVTTEFNESR